MPKTGEQFPQSPLFDTNVDEQELRRAARQIGDEAADRVNLDIARGEIMTGQLAALPGRIRQVAEARALNAAGLMTNDEFEKVLKNEAWKQGAGPGICICE